MPIHVSYRRVKFQGKEQNINQALIVMDLSYRYVDCTLTRLSALYHKYSLTTALTADDITWSYSRITWRNYRLTAWHILKDDRYVEAWTATWVSSHRHCIASQHVQRLAHLPLQMKMISIQYAIHNNKTPKLPRKVSNNEILPSVEEVGKKIRSCSPGGKDMFVWMSTSATREFLPNSRPLKIAKCELTLRSLEKQNQSIISDLRAWTLWAHCCMTSFHWGWSQSRST